MLGYHIKAHDDTFGHVEDLLVDPESWAIRYLIIDTRNWWPGPPVLLGVEWANDIDWASRTLAVDMDAERIKACPPYDPNTPRHARVRSGAPPSLRAVDVLALLSVATQNPARPQQRRRAVMQRRSIAKISGVLSALGWLVAGASAQAKDFRALDFGAPCETLQAQEAALGAGPYDETLPSGFQYAFRARDLDRDVVIGYACKRRPLLSWRLHLLRA